MHYKIAITCFAVLFLITSYSDGQNIQDSFRLNSKVYDRINNQAVSLQSHIDKSTIKTVRRLKKKEEKLKKKLAAKDSLAAKLVFAQNKYDQFAEQLKNRKITKKLNEYIPRFDSLKTSITFLNESKSLTSKLPLEFAGKIKSVNLNVVELESKLQKADEIKDYIKQRKQYLKEQLVKYDMLNDLKKLNKVAYYYQQQLVEYKSYLKDPKKVEEKALAQLKKLPAFNDFMRKNSQLAQLFKVPDNYGSLESLAGLQTRSSVQAALQTRFSSAGVNPQQYLNQQMQAAQGELNKLKDKINNAGGGSSDLDMPDFKPNTQKTKSFLKRLEYGANIQTQKTNGWLPVTSDLALTIGYKLNDKSTIGIGSSYKMGWGSSISHIKLTSQGMGLRSFVDYKVKGGFWVSGGYEQNYQHEFDKIDVLKDFSSWQSSGLIGLTKKYKIGKKTNNLQILWDFLSYQQVPRTQPIKFRVGYTF